MPYDASWHERGGTLDMFGRQIVVGHTLLRPVVYGSCAPGIERRKVTAVEDGKIYLDGSKVPLQYPRRTVIWLGGEDG